MAPGMNLPITTVANLPYEVAVQVFCFLDIPTLKSCRLANRLLEPPASAALFSTIHITTTIKSLEHATSIARSPRLRNAVKTFCYHASTLVASTHGSLDESTGDFANAPRNFVEFDLILSALPERRKSLLLPLWQDYIAISTARRDLESHGYVSSRLRALLTYFRNIATIRLLPVVPESKYLPGEHMPYFSRIDEDAFTDIVAACHDREDVRCLEARSLHWGSFRPCNDMSSLCEGLRELYLFIDDRNIGFPYSHMRDEFDKFLGLCRNLEVLEMDLDSHKSIWGDHCGQIKLACDLVLGRVWEKLEQVKLINFLTSQSRLETFFVINSASLREVRLECLSIVVHGGVQEFARNPTGEIADAFPAALKASQNQCHQLERVKISGGFWHPFSRNIKELVWPGNVAFADEPDYYKGRGRW